MAASDDAEPIEVRLFLQAVFERYGYDLRDYSPGSVARRLSAVMSRLGIAHLGDLQHRILHDPIFFEGVLDDLTIHVTEMFRDPAFYRSFRDHVVPLLRTYPLLKIWHAGCSTGEEVFGTAILLSEEGLYDRVQMYATDLSVRVLEHARQGVYEASCLPTFTDNYREAGGSRALSDYYTDAYDRFSIRDALRTNILFFQHNLVSDHVFAEVHVIVCRNVLIYFGEKLRREVLKKFSQSLVAGGFLCLGNSERLDTAGRDSAFIEMPGTERIYRAADRVGP